MEELHTETQQKRTWIRFWPDMISAWDFVLAMRLRHPELRIVYEPAFECDFLCRISNRHIPGVSASCYISTLPGCVHEFVPRKTHGTECTMCNEIRG
jgi:hypothetical protein